MNDSPTRGVQAIARQGAVRAARSVRSAVSDCAPALRRNSGKVRQVQRTGSQPRSSVRSGFFEEIPGNP